VTDDFDGDLRDLVAPDIGADEVDRSDLGITKTDGVATALPGSSTTYTIVATNAGPAPVTGAGVADTFPAACTSVTWSCVGAGGGTCTASGAGNINDSVNLPVGASVTYTAVCAISPGATGTLSNTATVTSSVLDPDPTDNSATDVTTLLLPTDVAITKDNGVTSVTTGQTVTYTIVAANLGSNPALASPVTDTFPATCTNVSWTCVGAGGGTCTASGSGNIADSVNLPVGASVTYTASCTVSGTASGTLSNTASIGVGAGDPNPGNNSATDTDLVVVLPLLSDGFESGDLSAWGGVQTLFRVYQVLSVSGATSAELRYDLAALPGDGFAPHEIAVAADDAGRKLFALVARRTEAASALELRLEVAGGDASGWVTLAGSAVRFDWAAGGGGYVAVAIDGRLALWVDGFDAGTAPASMSLLRAE
jgi:uncharacterized repeat protein (TIGR01451 family)